MKQVSEYIVDMEWTLFDTVQNKGGRASCQDDKSTFFIMRGSQIDAWNDEMRTSYGLDLQQAGKEGRNLLAEKYGYMMARTNPAEFAELAHQLPPRSAKKERYIEQICQAHVNWLQGLAVDYPCLTKQGRGITKESDSSYTTSFETYLWGELATYSMETLEFYWQYVLALQRAGKNLNRMILEGMVKCYGYGSLEDAERAQRA